MQTHQVEKRIGARLFAEPRGREPEIAAIMLHSGPHVF
jgi:hypothetical protein